MFSKQMRLLLVGVGMMAIAIVLSLSITEEVNAQATFGTNWSAQYFNNTNFQGNPVASVSYPNGLNFNFPGVPLQSDNATPVPGIGQDNWSVLFTSTQNFPAAGNYSFFGQVDDLITVVIDGQQVYSDTTPGTEQFNFAVSLTAGPHTIQVRFVEFAQTATLQFQWQLGGAGPVFTPTPAGPFVNVVGVRGLAFRTGPYLGASLIGVLRPNRDYEVDGLSNDEGGPFTWYRIRFQGQVGWASGRYLTLKPANADIRNRRNDFERIDDAPNIPGVVAVTRATMNFRVRPSTRSPIIAQIPWGFEVPLIGRTVQGGEDFWYHVRYGDIEGWIFADFVTVRGPVEAVPIR